MNLAGDLATATYKALTQSQVLVLTGVGASVPLGMPAMDSFVEALERELRGFALTITQSQTRDLEHILGEMAFYESLQERARANAYFRALIKESDLDQVASRVRDLREHVFDKIVSTYGIFPPQAKQKAVDLYHDLYFHLLSVGGMPSPVLPIFTTNYDLTFEGINEIAPDFRICTGLTQIGVSQVWKPEVYKSQMDYKFAVFRLHGCSHWVKERSTGDLYFQRLPDRKDLGNKEPYVLYPVPNKEDRIEEQPFRTGYQHLKICLASAKSVIIIGYSGRDPAVQEHFEEALGANPEKSFIVVTAGEKLRPELERLKRLARNFRHLPGGIERNTQELLDLASGKLRVALANSVGGDSTGA